MTDELHDDGAPQQIVVAQFDAAEHRHAFVIDPLLVARQLAFILAVGITDAADCADAHADDVAVAVGGITLEVARQFAFPLGDGQLVAGFGEMVHADIDVAGVGQPADRLLQDLQLDLGRGQGAFVDLALRLEQVRHVGVVEQRETIRRGGDDPIQGTVEAGNALGGQAVNQVDAD